MSSFEGSEVSVLPPWTPQSESESLAYVTAKDIARVLRKEGFQAVFAGGWVRDRMLGRQSCDVDIATDATEKQLKQIFNKKKPGAWRGNLTENRINTVVVIDDRRGTSSEVSSFRGHDRRSPRSDVMMRDFTMNALLYDTHEDKVHDYVGGVEDIRNGVLRAVGKAQDRFHEDPSRIMRAIRLAAVLSFTIEKRTYKAMLECQDLLGEVSEVRLITEVVKASKSNAVWAASLQLLLDSGLHAYVFPDVSRCVFRAATRVAHEVEKSGKDFDDSVTGVRLGSLLLLADYKGDIKGKECCLLEGKGSGSGEGEEEEDKDTVAGERQGFPGRTLLKKRAALVVGGGGQPSSTASNPSDQKGKDKRQTNLVGISKRHKKDVMCMYALDYLERMSGEYPKEEETFQLLEFYSNPEQIVDCCLISYSHMLPKEEAKGFLAKHARRRERMARAIEMQRDGVKIITSKVLEREGVKPGPEMGQLIRLAQVISAEENLFEEKNLLHALKMSPLWESLGERGR